MGPIASFACKGQSKMSSIKSERVELRLDSHVFDKIDEWRSKEADLPNRSEAIRRLIQKGLTASDRQAYVGIKLQIMLAAKSPGSENYLSDAFVFAFIYDVYPAFCTGHESWAEPFEPCFEVSKEMIVDLHSYLEDQWKRNQKLTFNELEKAYRSKEWNRDKLIYACRYMFLNEMFLDQWESLLLEGEYPPKAKSINKKTDRSQILVA